MQSPDTPDSWRGHSCLPRRDSSRRLSIIKAILFEPACLADAEGEFDDVQPALAELKSMGIQLHAAAEPDQTMYITDNAEGLAREIGRASCRERVLRLV